MYYNSEGFLVQKKYPVILSIASTDSGGGAGIQADLKTTTVLGGFGVSVAVALTAQNGEAVYGVHELPTDFAVLQLMTVLDGFSVKAAKTGMLFSSAIMKAIAPVIKKTNIPLVVDPVCVSQSGYRLMQDDAIETMRQIIVPLATLLTPNIPEAETLSGISIATHEDMEHATKKLLDLGAKAVLLKGGHAINDNPDVITDWLALPGKPLLELPHKRIETPNNHGTGCTLSAAIATFLGMGDSLEVSIVKAQEFLSKALATSFSPGVGAGPPNFLGGTLV